MSDTYDDNNATIPPGTTQTIGPTQSLSVEGVLTNEGTVAADAGNLQGGTGYYSANIDINGAVSLQGSGTISLNTVEVPGGQNGDVYGVLDPYGDGASSVDNVNNTIAGAGIIDLSNGFGGALAFTNEAGGVIDGTDAAYALTIQHGGSLTNKGLIESTSTGGLQFLNTSVDNAGGVIQASGSGSFVDLNGATIEGGTLTASGGGLITVQNSGSSANDTLDGSSYGAVTISTGSTVQVNPGQTLQLDGTIINEGTISLPEGETTAAGYYNDGLGINGAVTLQGGGTISLSTVEIPGGQNGNVDGVIGPNGGGTGSLDNINTTIAGAGEIDLSNGFGGSLAFTNEAAGVIDGTDATYALIIEYGGSFTNKGLIESTSTGGLQLTGNVGINNAGGTISAAGKGSSVDLDGATITGGTLTTSGGGVIQVTGGTDVLSGVTQAAGSTTLVEAGQTLTLAGATALAGTLQIAGTFDVTGTTTSSGGKVLLTTSGALLDISGGTGAEFVGKLGGVAGTTIDLGANTLTVTEVAGSGTSVGTFAGVIKDGGSAGGSGGSLNVNGTAPLTLTGANTYTGKTSVSGTLAISGAGSIASSSKVSLTASGATFDISGAISAVSINKLGGVAGSVIDLGAGTLNVNEGVAGTFAGVVQDGGAAGGTGGNLTVAGAAALTLTGVETYTGKTSVSGTLDLSGSASIHSSSKVALTTAGATLDISGASGTEVVNKLGGVSGTVTDLGGENLKIKVQSGTVDTYSGLLQDGGVAGGTGGKVELGGTGTLMLNGANNTYTGGTTIDAGTLDVAALGAAGTGTITFANPAANGVATLQIDAAALTAVTPTASAASATPTVTSGGQQYTFGNEIAGATSANQVIDLTSLAYVPGSTTATVVGGSSLVVNDGSSTVTLALASSTSKSAFVTASDNHGGTLVYDPPATTAKVDPSWIEAALADFGGVSGDAHAQTPMHDALGQGSASPFEAHHAHAGPAIRGA